MRRSPASTCARTQPSAPTTSALSARDSRLAIQLDDDTVRLAKGANFAIVVTLMPDGQPQALITWVDTDGEHILVNTEPERQRAKNVARDPRVTVLIHTPDDPWDWSEIRGVVVETVGGQGARDHIDLVSRKYLGVDFGAPVGPTGRIILKIAPTKINTPATLGVLD